jgi:glutathione peroxidase
MKFLLIICLFYTTSAMSQSSVYNLALQTATGKAISLSNYKGQKILIASVSQDNLDKKAAFYFWDSLQKVNPKVVIIIIPANDFGTDTDSVLKLSIISAAPANIVLASAANVKKDKGQNQNSIMRWLTTGSENSHFDQEVNSDYQIYVISESGVLYAVLEKGVPLSVIDEVLKQDDVKDSMH